MQEKCEDLEYHVEEYKMKKNSLTEDYNKLLKALNQEKSMNRESKQKI